MTAAWSHGVYTYLLIVCTDERSTFRHLESAPKYEPDLWRSTIYIHRPRVCGCFKGAGRRGVGASVPPFSLVASCGLDHFLRVHSLEDRSLWNKVYLKSRLNCVLLSSRDLELGSTGVNGDSGELDEVWNTMEMIKEKAKKRETDEAVVEEAEKMKMLLKKQTRRLRRGIKHCIYF
ncbi:unnamed protein product [Oncorhynchus mykiss]|uniref:Uncharacterized protein n=1 Tax=Oncorhynchus mykiss TaxID=8022 RepID=A0A060W9F4_ONCMY|nr:unnamed protein product [Oncorhynchus mykiss]